MEQRCIAATALLHHTAQSTDLHFLMSSDSTVAIAFAVHPCFIVVSKGECVISASGKVQDSCLCHGKIRLG